MNNRCRDICNCLRHCFELGYNAFRFGTKQHLIDMDSQSIHLIRENVTVSVRSRDEALPTDILCAEDRMMLRTVENDTAFIDR